MKAKFSQASSTLAARMKVRFSKIFKISWLDSKTQLALSLNLKKCKFSSTKVF